MLGAHRPGLAPRLLETLQLVERRQERPRLEVAVRLDQSNQSAPATDGGLEGEPGGGDAIGLVGRLLDSEGRRIGPVEVLGQQLGGALGFSTVAMFQLNETRSRQKLVAANMPAARATSRARSASSKSCSHRSAR
jgi:hypothetical protein